MEDERRRISDKVATIGAWGATSGILRNEYLSVIPTGKEPCQAKEVPKVDAPTTIEQNYPITTDIRLKGGTAMGQ